MSSRRFSNITSHNQERREVRTIAAALKSRSTEALDAVAQNKFFTYLLFLVNFAIRLKNKYLSKFTHTLVFK